MSEQKPDCYKCRWRGKVSGSVHSCCRHPSLQRVTDDPMINMLQILGKGGVGRVNPLMVTSKELNIRASEYGIGNGWFNFPNNFDPLWLENCDGFEEVVEMKTADEEGVKK